jgi:pantoate--beta-alanine ligase
VREKDGLALSSRNSYLAPEERERAPALHRALRNAADAILAGQAVPAALGEARNALLVSGFSRIDYFALVDAATLEPLETAGGDMRLIAAAVIGTTRLIDNIAVQENHG